MNIDSRGKNYEFRLKYKAELIIFTIN